MVSTKVTCSTEDVERTLALMLGPERQVGLHQTWLDPEC